MNKQEATELIAEQLNIASAAVAEAERISDLSGVSFSMDLGGYGMGGYYNPEPKKPEDWDSSDDWSASDEDYGWQASSHSC